MEGRVVFDVRGGLSYALQGADLGGGEALERAELAQSVSNGRMLKLTMDAYAIDQDATPAIDGKFIAAHIDESVMVLPKHELEALLEEVE